jgi:hypothetical protein
VVGKARERRERAIEDGRVQSGHAAKELDVRARNAHG